MKLTTNYKLRKPDGTDVVNIDDLNSNMDTLDVEVAKRVEKETGKGLSTNDYTTVEKNKLAGVATGANNYSHPATHPASIITEAVNKRFMTDAERATLKDIAAKIDNGMVEVHGEYTGDGKDLRQIPVGIKGYIVNISIASGVNTSKKHSAMTAGGDYVSIISNDKGSPVVGTSDNGASLMGKNIFILNHSLFNVSGVIYLYSVIGLRD